jgi:hypothetical protein
VRAFCRYSQATFWYKVDELFELQRHSQRRVLLRPKDGISFRGAHTLAFHFEEKVIFRLIKETRAVSQATIHTPEEGANDLELDDREMQYRDMVAEAV